MIFLIDNYDSFSYNLYQLIGSINTDIRVIRNDEMSVKEIERLNPECIIISPGPGRPEDAGVSVELVSMLGSKVPILGVCLGHQAICMAYGCKISYANQLMHGKQSKIILDNDCEIFKDCSTTIDAARYHSLAIVEDTVPDFISITARCSDNEIMAIKHKSYDVYGVQFHPESIMTPAGKEIMRRFLNISKLKEKGNDYRSNC